MFDDPGFGYADYDFVNWREDTAPARELMNTADTDLTAFRNGAVRSCSGTGGLIRQYLLSPRSDTTRNCNMILLLWMTLPVCICFRASTTVPGGPGADRVDWLGVISGWVETDEAPDHLVADKHDDDGNVSFTRKLCPYPLVAEYDGQGDPDDEASYRCASDS